MTNIISIILLSVLSNITMSHKESTYNSLKHKAELKIIQNELDSSLYYYDLAFTNFNYPFAKDILAASFVSHYANNTDFLYKHLELLMLRGASKTEIEVFKTLRPKDSMINQLYVDFELYHKTYIQNIDFVLEKNYVT